MPLSDSWLRANLGKQIAKSYVKSDTNRLSVRVSPKGKLTFQFRYPYNGQAKRLDIGSYPNLSLKDARAERDRLNKILEHGFDPKLYRLQENKPSLMLFHWNNYSDNGMSLIV